ncbi:MAG TPA: hypothetical protein VMM59_03085 [Thermohalobaculum sp.]|nr:hypothetical protein [Thermohalobaculum sp.]
MDFILMLTREDRTVEDCLEVLELVRPLNLRHIGFKDVGVEMKTLRTLTERIKATGATAYIEVVSTTAELARRSIRAAAEIGVDRVTGGQEVDFALDLLGPAGIGYYPFPGRPAGHPTRLGGTAETIARDCRRMRAAGCAGVDLLAYRATEADPLDLVRAARAALDGGYLIVAGSIDSPERIGALAAAGADAFTIGTAIFNASFSPTKGSICSQLEDVLQACEAAHGATA